MIFRTTYKLSHMIYNNECNELKYIKESALNSYTIELSTFQQLHY